MQRNGGQLPLNVLESLSSGIRVRILDPGKVS